jgi:hypothetical protein
MCLNFSIYSEKRRSALSSNEFVQQKRKKRKINVRNAEKYDQIVSHPISLANTYSI